MVLKTPVGVRLCENATLKHRMQTGTVFDDKKGHDVPEWSYVEIPATLDQVSNPPRSLTPPQQSSPFIQFYTGWAAIDLNPTYHQAVPATISGKDGVFYLEPTSQASGVERFRLGKLTGHPVSGWFAPGAKP